MPDRIIPRRTLSDAVAERLTTLITKGAYPVGSKLPAEKELAAQFGVGRSSMREAVRTLAAAGYLRSTHGIGVFVVSDRPSMIAPLDLTLPGGSTVSDLCEVRIAIEGKTAELAARRLTDHHRELLQSIVAAASDPTIAAEEFVRLDGQFHREIAEASGNPLLLYMWDSIAPHFQEYSQKVIDFPGRRDRAHEDHSRIAEAIIAGDGALASELACEHVRTVQDELSKLHVTTTAPRPAG